MNRYDLPKIKTPIKNHYYVVVYKSQRVVAQFLHQACWNLNFKIVDDCYIDRADGELDCKNYSIVFVK